MVELITTDGLETILVTVTVAEVPVFPAPSVTDAIKVFAPDGKASVLIVPLKFVPSQIPRVEETPFRLRDTLLPASLQVPLTVKFCELFAALMKLPSVGVVIAMVGTALSTVNEVEVAAVNGLPAKSDHAELPIEMVGEPSPVQLVRLTTAVVAEVTFTDFVQVAPLPLKVMAESIVAVTSDVGFASAKVRVKLFAMEEVTVATAGEEMVIVGFRISTLNEFVAVVVNPV